MDRGAETAFLMVQKSQGENVRLDINQVIKDVTDYLRPNTGSISYVVPIVSNREVKTFITLKNHQTIIIGGLISNKTIEVIKSIPFLSKLPIPGKMFFQDTSKTHEKSTLFVFITPHIINSPKEFQEEWQLLYTPWATLRKERPPFPHHTAASHR